MMACSAGHGHRARTRSANSFRASPPAYNSDHFRNEVSKLIGIGFRNSSHGALQSSGDRSQMSWQLLSRRPAVDSHRILARCERVWQCMPRSGSRVCTMVTYQFQTSKSGTGLPSRSTHLVCQARHLQPQARLPLPQQLSCSWSGHSAGRAECSLARATTTCSHSTWSCERHLV